MNGIEEVTVAIDEEFMETAKSCLDLMLVLNCRNVAEYRGNLYSLFLKDEALKCTNSEAHFLCWVCNAFLQVVRILDCI